MRRKYSTIYKCQPEIHEGIIIIFNRTIMLIIYIYI